MLFSETLREVNAIASIIIHQDHYAWRLLLIFYNVGVCGFEGGSLTPFALLYRITRGFWPQTMNGMNAT